MRRKILAGVLSLVMVMSFMTACGKDSSSDADPSSKADSSSAADTTTTTSAATPAASSEQPDSSSEAQPDTSSESVAETTTTSAGKATATTTATTTSKQTEKVTEQTTKPEKLKLDEIKFRAMFARDLFYTFKFDDSKYRYLPEREMTFDGLPNYVSFTLPDSDKYHDLLAISVKNNKETSFEDDLNSFKGDYSTVAEFKLASGMRAFWFTKAYDNWTIDRVKTNWPMKRLYVEIEADSKLSKGRPNIIIRAQMLYHDKFDLTPQQLAEMTIKGLTIEN